MNRSFFRFIALFTLCASLLVSGCGFHLRGKVDLPENLRSLYVKGNDAELMQSLKNNLAFNDVHVVDAAENVPVLDVSDAEYKKEVSTTNSNGIVTRYKLIYRVAFGIESKEGTSLPLQTLEQSRTLSYDSNNVLLFEREEEFLKKDMRKELVAQMLRRISKSK